MRAFTGPSLLNKSGRTAIMLLLAVVALIISASSVKASITPNSTDDPWYASVINNTGWYAPVACNLDQYSYCLRNCTSYTAARLAASGVPVNDIKSLGNGGEWYAKAENKGIPVGSVPKIGAAAVIPGNPGHVSYVTGVNSNGSINVMSYDGYTETPYNEMNTTRYSHFVYFAGGTSVGTLPKDDIVAFEPNDGTQVSKYMQGKSSGNGQFQWGFSNLNNLQTPYQFEMGDINGDNKDDIVAFEENDGTHVSRYITASSNNNGTFNYGYTNLVNMGTPFEFHMGDINGDNKDDIVAFEATSSSSGRYMRGISQGNGQFAWDFTNLINMSKPSHFALGDINGDNKDDIVAFEPNDGTQVSKYMSGASNGNGTFNWGYTNLTNLQKPSQFEMGDINGDNKDDIVAFEPNDGTHVSRYITASSNGNGTFNYGYTNVNNVMKPKQFEMGDINGDNKDDIVAFEPNDGTQVSKYMQGTSQGNGQFSWGYSNLVNVQAPTDFDIGNFAE